MIKTYLDFALSHQLIISNLHSMCTTLPMCQWWQHWTNSTTFHVQEIQHFLEYVANWAQQMWEIHHMFSWFTTIFTFWNYHFVRRYIIVILTHGRSCLSWVYPICIRFQFNIFIKQVWYFLEYASIYRFPSSLFFMVLQQCIFMYIFMHVCCAYM